MKRSRARRYALGLASLDNRQALEIPMAHLDHPEPQIQIPKGSDQPPPEWLPGTVLYGLHEAMTIVNLPERIRRVEDVARLRAWWEENKDKPDSFFWPHRAAAVDDPENRQAGDAMATS